MEERTLDKRDFDFVHWYRKYRDVHKAAERAGIAKNQAKKTYERAEIRDEIERQDSVVERERARVQVEAEGITRNFLDIELTQLIMLDAKKHPAAKLRGIELGYVRAGVLQVGSTKSLDLTPIGNDDEAPVPTVYQTLMQVGVTVNAAPIIAEGSQPQKISSAPTQKQFPVTFQAIDHDAPVPGGTPVRAGKMKIG